MFDGDIWSRIVAPREADRKQRGEFFEGQFFFHIHDWSMAQFGNFECSNLLRFKIISRLLANLAIATPRAQCISRSSTLTVYFLHIGTLTDSE
jgi:hypothetical protein